MDIASTHGFDVLGNQMEMEFPKYTIFQEIIEIVYKTHTRDLQLKKKGIGQRRRNILYEWLLPE